MFFAFDLFVWHRSIHYIGPGLATVLGNFQVVFIAVISFLVFKEKVNWKFYISIFLALIGIFLLCGINWNGNTHNYKLGIVLGLVTAVFYTGYILTLNFSSKLKNKFSPSSNIFWVCISSGIVLGIISKFSGESFALISLKNLVVLLAYGIFCQCFGWIFISSSLSNIPVSIAGLILLMQPALSMAWDMIFFKRPTSIIDLIGFIISLGAIYLGSTNKEAENEKIIKNRRDIISLLFFIRPDFFNIFLNIFPIPPFKLFWLMILFIGKIDSTSKNIKHASINFEPFIPT